MKPYWLIRLVPDPDIGLGQKVQHLVEPAPTTTRSGSIPLTSQGSAQIARGALGIDFERFGSLPMAAIALGLAREIHWPA